MQSDLVALRSHLLIHVREIGRGVQERRADGEERDFDVFLADDLQDFLRVFWATVVDGEGEGVGALAGEDEVSGGQFRWDDRAGGDGGHDFDDGELDGNIWAVEAFEGEADGAGEVDVEVRDWDVDVAVVRIAGSFEGIPCFGEGSDGVGASGVVLLKSDREGDGAAVGDVEVGALVLVPVSARARDLRVEAVVCIGGLDGQAAAAPCQTHAIIGAVPEAKRIAVLVCELVDDKRGGGSTWSRHGGAGSGSWGGRANDVFASGVPTVEGHWANRHRTIKAAEEDSDNLAGVKGREFAERNGVQLLGAIKSPAKLCRGLTGADKVIGTARRR